METVFSNIIDFLNTRDDVKKVEYLGPEVGDVCYITMADGRLLVLTLSDSGLRAN